MFYQLLFSPQVKRCVITSYKYGIYAWPHEFPNDLNLRILGNLEISEKSQTSYSDSLAPSPPRKMKILLTVAKTLEKRN